MIKKDKITKIKEFDEVKRSERYYADLQAPMMFAFIEAALLFLMCTVLNLYVKTESNARLIELVCNLTLPIYLVSSGIVCLVYAVRNTKTRKARLESRRLESEIYDMFRSVIDLPYAIANGTGRVRVVNGALSDILGLKRATTGMPLSDFCSVPIKTLISEAKNRELFLSDSIYDMPEENGLHESSVTKLADGRRYSASSYVFKLREENYYFIVFRDVEDFLSLSEKHEAESPVIAYIQLDNLRELAQYVRADYRSASAEAENILRAWVADMHGFIREQTGDKYVAVFSQAEFEKRVKNDFEVQKRIMALKIGDNSFPVTVSMGISPVGETLEEKEKNASHALTMAIARGGNQVAVKRRDASGYTYFGGTHKTVENNTTVISRVSAEILEEHIIRASNVIIMGHTAPDFDSIGSCVGVARFAMSVMEDAVAAGRMKEKVSVNIAIEKKGESYDVVMRQLAPLKIYDDIFIDPVAARDLVTSDTVLIICDVNNRYIFAAPELANMIKKIAVLDHHRIANTLSFDPFLQYIEATKSSASEIVSEIFLYSRFADTLHKEEAEVLLSGIMLDTKNFTRNAGTQTIEATHYLYTRGAHTAVVREFFNESLDEILLTGEFESKARLYRDDIAITWMMLERAASGEDRVIASKVADNLLRVKGVKASFALIKIGNDVVISGRSKGEVNVQLILEKLQGGGHFDIAGAQVKNASLTRTCEMLKSAIDDYFEYDHQD
ncbi:MAG: DHH family phosphoesterase [Clostridia bacterium]|nr:DHH family phosphoesterase [Clostridia bacterium]